MIKIINKKRYNTETAICIATESYLYPNDFNYWKESLYITKKGAYFIAGKGGAMTKYRHLCGTNSYCEGDGLESITGVEAIKWLERYNFVDEIEKHFNSYLEDA